MSRAGYSDDCDNEWAAIRWRGAVTSAFRGARGQRFLRLALEALDAMENKRLVPYEFEANGDFCVLGAVAHHMKIDLPQVAYNDETDADEVGDKLDIAQAMVREIMYMNDEGVFFPESAEHRYSRMRAYIESEIRP